MFAKFNIDPRIFIPATSLILITCSLVAFYPASSEAIINDVFKWVTQRFGWLYLLAGISSFIFMAWLAFGRLGRIKLGRADETPEFSKFSWVSMLFCAGIGISLCNWAFVEPLYFLDTPPMHIEKGSDTAIEWAAMYPIFHWGLVPWALYLVPALPIAYELYVRRNNAMRFSQACRALIGDHADGLLGKIIDIIVILSIIGGVGTSLGLSVPLVSQLLGQALGFEPTFQSKIIVLLVWVVMIGWSVYKGLGKGIQILSNINSVLAFILLAFVFIAGPTLFILELWSNSLGLFLDNFFRINTWTDPVQKGGFPEGWTIFYWAWWIAYGPMMGLFVARISRGRTIKELILNGVLWGTLGTSSFFAVWGGYALYLETHHVAPVLDILLNKDIPSTVIAILQTLPAVAIILPLFIGLCFIFLATTVDSSAYILASICSTQLSGYEEPTRTNRILWTVLIAIVGTGLLLVGGLKAAQTSTIIGALPMIPVLFIMVISLLKAIKQDFGDALYAPTLTLPASTTGGLK